MAIVALWLLWVPLGCNDSPDVTGATPAKQFTLHEVRIDEKRADGTRWRGTAATSEGDLSVNDFTDADLTVTTPEGRVYLVHSPRGTFDFDRDAGTFEDTRVTDESGGVVLGGRAQYDGAAHVIHGEGPTRFSTPAMRAKAGSSTIHLGDGTVDVAGPVVGRYYPGHID